MQVLFIHGMGRSPLSGWPMLHRLRRAGIKTRCFGYSAHLDDFSSIVARLASRMEKLAAEGDYVLIGHSLGGVLLRAALPSLPAATRQPRHVFLLGSPLRQARLAQGRRDKPLFRLATRDCGQLLASQERMQQIGPLSVPTTVVIGIRGLRLAGGPFAGEANDGLLAASEASAAWITDEVRVPVIHTLLPASRQVSTLMLQRLAEHGLLPSARAH